MRVKSIIILSFVLFMLGFTLVIPIFTDEKSLFAEEITNPYDVFYSNTGNSFIGSNYYKEINETYYISWIRNNFNWKLQQSNGFGWFDCNNLMDISKDYDSDNLSWKITLNFTSDNIGVDGFNDYRFIFYTNISNLEYVDFDNHTLNINHTFQNGDEYNLFFDYSDILVIPNIITGKGIKDNKSYWFVRKNNVQSGKSFSLDPILGYDTEGSSFQIVSSNNFGTVVENIVGTNFTMTEDGILNNISVYVKESSDDASLYLKTAVYWTSNDTLMVECDSQKSKSGDTPAWIEFDFTGGNRGLDNGVNYALVVYADAPTSERDGIEVAYDSSGGNEWKKYIKYSENNYPTFPNNPTFIHTLNQNVSIYAQYTASASEQWNLNTTCSSVTGGNITSTVLNLTCSSVTGGNITSAILNTTCSSVTGGNISGYDWYLNMTCSSVTGGNITSAILNTTCSSVTGGNISEAWILNTTCSSVTGGNISEVNYTIDDIWEMINWINNTLFEGGDTMNIGLDTELMSIGLTLLLFLIFFYIGYTSEKRSGGLFILFSGFTLISFEYISTIYLNSLYLLPLLTPVSIFIIIIGIRKWLYTPEKEKTKSEGQ